MKTFFDLSAEDASKEMQTDVSNGLSPEEAAARLQKYGPNRLEGGKEKSLLEMVLEQLKDFLVIILMIAAVISIALGEALEGVIILAIVVLNTILGVYQENKASNALKALKEMASPHAKVLRGGEIVEVPSSDVVPGDVVILEAGDYVPADVRLIESVNLKIDEAALTGESVPVEKDANAVLPDGTGSPASSGSVLQQFSFHRDPRRGIHPYRGQSLPGEQQPDCPGCGGGGTSAGGIAAAQLLVPHRDIQFQHQTASFDTKRPSPALGRAFFNEKMPHLSTSELRNTVSLQRVSWLAFPPPAHLLSPTGQWYLRLRPRLQ